MGYADRMLVFYVIWPMSICVQTAPQFPAPQLADDLQLVSTQDVSPGVMNSPTLTSCKSSFFYVFLIVRTHSYFR
ncbi:hypothetical protein F4777DRAFT_6813 [Nemania sp. FL0916]|nr:hypothetical protein F4777DRAFT_6813 [Nemania sp. FL0916]